MDNKIIALIAVAVVVVAGGAAAVFLMSPGDNGNNGNDDKKDHYDDFTMLDDSKYFDKGFYYTLDCSESGKTFYKVTVDNKNDTAIDYTLNFKYSDTYDGFDKTHFASFFQFSIDDSNPPAGINVVKDENTYTITGKGSIGELYGYSAVAEFNNVVLTADGLIFTSGSGNVKITGENSEKVNNHLNVTYTFSTASGKCVADSVQDEIIVNDCSTSDLFSYPLRPHSMYLSDYGSDHPVKTSETKKIGNVDCEVYTYTSDDGTFSLFVYHGYILQKEHTSASKIVETLHIDKK